MSGEPSKLEDLQRWMQSALVSPRSSGREMTEAIVGPSPRLSGTEQLAIYQRNYILRLLKCMDEQFPALRHALGAELFSDFARQYLTASPSESYTLYELGARFPGYLEQTRPDRELADDARESWVNFMIDLAHYERHLFVMFDAPGHEGLPYADTSVPDQYLRLQMCFAVHAYRFPVGWYYHEVRAGKDPELPAQSRSYVAMVRKDFLTKTFLLAAGQFAFLGAMLDEAEISAALVAWAESTGISSEEARTAWDGDSGVRDHWIEAGFFIDIRTMS